MIGFLILGVASENANEMQRVPSFRIARIVKEYTQLDAAMPKLREVERVSVAGI